MKNLPTELAFHRWLVLIVFMSLVMYGGFCYYFRHTIIDPYPEEQRLFIRSVFYVMAIIAFPITNLIRHIQLRLNQTMPGEVSAKKRYGLTVLVSMVFMEVIGLLGLVMYLLGDDFNTLYIFLGLSALGLYLYRPKQIEYALIVDALSDQK